MAPDLLRVDDFCKRYSISRNTFYRLVKRGEIPLLKIGTSTRVRAVDAETWAASLESVATTDEVARR